VAPMIDAPDRAVRLVDRDASCGVDVLVVTTAQPRIDSDRSTPGGGGEWARSKGGDGQVRGNVTAVGERGVQLALDEIKSRQRVTEVRVDSDPMCLGKLSCDLGAEGGGPWDGRRGSERDPASSVAEDSRGLGSDEPCAVDQDPRGGRAVKDAAHTERIVQGVQMRHPSALQGGRAGNTRRQGAWRASRSDDQCVLVHAGSSAQVNGLLLGVHRLDAIPDWWSGQCWQMCVMGFEEAGGDSLVDQSAVIRGGFRIDDRGCGDL